MNGDRLLGLVLAASLTALCLSVVPPAFAQQSVTRAQYDLALSRTARAVSADINRSHECFVRTAFYSQTFQSGQGEATDRATRRLYGSVADAFRLRINDLLSQGQEVPEDYRWVGPAIFEGNAAAGRIAADWYRRDSAAPGFDQRARACYDEVVAAAGATYLPYLQVHALMTTDPQ